MLNVVLMLVTGLLILARIPFESEESVLFIFPFTLYMTTAVVANLIYMVGLIFEIIYLALWNQQIRIRDFENKFFRAALVMIIFINLVGAALFLISRFG